MPPEQRATSATLGVGFLGAGPATQAIHLPTLARLGGLFATVCVMDPDEELAKDVAAGAGADWCLTEDELLSRSDVDVVVICSPSHLHSAQVQAAAQRGVRAILCEKPLATDTVDAAAAVAAARAADVPLIIGAMHLFDPGWTSARTQLTHAAAESHRIRSTIVLPPNDRFENLATEMAPARAGGPPPAASADTRLRNSILGLAIHDLPLLRVLTDADPGSVTIRYARFLAPFGYCIVAAINGHECLLQASFSPAAEPTWTIEVLERDRRHTLHFPPSYVHTSGARLVTEGPEGTQETPPPAANGYEAEWRAIAAVADHPENAPDWDTALTDLSFAVEIADKAAAYVRSSDNGHHPIGVS